MISIQESHSLQPRKCKFETLWTASLDDIISDALLLRDQKEILVVTISESFYRISIHDGKIIAKINFQQTLSNNVTNYKILGQSKKNTIVYSSDGAKMNFFHLTAKKRKCVDYSDYSKGIWVLTSLFLSSRSILLIIDNKFVINFYTQKNGWKRPALKIRIPNRSAIPRSSSAMKIGACSLFDEALIAIRLIRGKQEELFYYSIIHQKWLTERAVLHMFATQDLRDSTIINTPWIHQGDCLSLANQFAMTHNPVRRTNDMRLLMEIDNIQQICFLREKGTVLASFTQDPSIHVWERVAEGWHLGAVGKFQEVLKLIPLSNSMFSYTNFNPEFVCLKISY